MVDTTNIIKITDDDSEYYYITVEDFNIDVSCGGVTISYFERAIKDHPYTRCKYMTFSLEQAKAIGEAIQKLVKI